MYLQVTVALPRLGETLRTICTLELSGFTFLLVSIGQISFPTIVLVRSIIAIIFQIAEPFVGNTLSVIASELVLSASGVGALLVAAISAIFVEITAPFLAYAFFTISTHPFIGTTF